MKEPIADLNIFAVSAHAAEVAINTAQNLDTGMAVPKNFIANLKEQIDTNQNQSTGKEGVTRVFSKGKTLDYSIPFEQAEAQHFAFLLAFHFGIATPAAWGTGYKHTITKSASRILPGFTAGQRLADGINKDRLYSNYVDSIKISLGKNTFAKIEGGIKATGKFDRTVSKITVNAAFNAVSLNLSQDGTDYAVQGGTAAARINNVHQIRVKVPATGEWQEVVPTTASGATPAEVDFAAPGVAATLTDYEILFVATEPAWGNFPANLEEPPMWCANLDIVVGGKWNGAALLGGRTIGKDIKTMDITSNRKMTVEQRPISGLTGQFANFAEAGTYESKITLDKEMRDFILSQRLQDLESFAVRSHLIGAEFEAGKNFFVDLVWPKCFLVDDPKSVDGPVNVEKGDILVAEDDTYGFIWAQVANKVPVYAG